QHCKPPGEPRQQMLVQRRRVDELDRLPNKGFDQHAACLLTRDAARAKIKERGLVEIADRGAVTTLHVVGVDFQLWLGVDRRARSEHKVAAELVRIDLLRARSYGDAALKGAVSAPGGNSFENFAGFAARRPVVDRGEDVHLLAA